MGPTTANTMYKIWPVAKLRQIEVSLKPVPHPRHIVFVETLTVIGQLVDKELQTDKIKEINNYPKMKALNCSILTLIVALFLCLSCQSNSGADNADLNRKLVLRWQEVWNTGQTDKLSEFVAADFICHYLTDVEWKGIEGAKTEVTNWRKLFPDWHEEVVDFIIEKDKVVIRYNSTGTHSGTYEGIDSTGTKVMISEVSIFRIKDGKLAEQWCFPDDLGLKNQIVNSLKPN